MYELEQRIRIYPNTYTFNTFLSVMDYFVPNKNEEVSSFWFEGENKPLKKSDFSYL